MRILFLQNKINIKKNITIIFFVFYILFISLSPISNTNAAFNKQINYQGKLTTSAGIAVTNGTYNMEFVLYDDLTLGGTHIMWTETRTGANKVQITNGLFNVLLGEVTSLSGVDFNKTLYLGVNIGGTGTPGWDGEMAPRKKLGAVPAAIVAESALNIIGGSAGSIPFQTAANTTSFSSNFFWDNVNARLGIGTTAPVVALDVQRAYTGILPIANFQNTSEGLAFGNGTLINFGNYSNISTISVNRSGFTDDLNFNTYSGGATTTKMTVTGNGNVGIGTTEPGDKLHVALPAVGANSYLRLSSATASTFNTRFGTTASNQYAWFTNVYYTGSVFAKDDATLGAWRMTQVLSTTDAANTFNFNYFPVGSVTPGSQLTMLGTGEVGIGTAAPGTGTGLDIQAGATSDQLRMGGSTNYYKIGRNTTSGFLDFNGTQTGYIGYTFSGGNVGIGTTGPSNKLEVSGDSANPSNANGQIRLSGATDSTKRLLLGVNTTAGTPYGFIQSVQAGVAFTDLALNESGGNVGIGTTSPLTALQIGKVGTANTITLGSAIDGSVDFVQLSDNIAGAGHPGLNLWDTGQVSATLSTLNAHFNMNVGLDVSGPITTTGSFEATGLSSNGVGVGVQNMPGGTLRLRSAGGDSTYISFIANGEAVNGAIGYLASSRDFVIDSGGSGVLDGTERFRITSTGNVGIGTTAPTAKLDILDTTLAGSGSLAGSVLNLAQTWNTTGAPTAIKLNVTRTASNSDSDKLMDLQVGGVSKFSVDAAGRAIAASYLSGIYFKGTVTEVGYTSFQSVVTPSSTTNGAHIILAPHMARTNTSGIQQIVRIDAPYNQVGSTASNTDLLINRTETAVGSGTQLLIDAQVGGVSKFKVDNVGNVTVVGNIIPIADNTSTLGNGTYRWSNIYASNSYNIGSSGSYNMAYSSSVFTNASTNTNLVSASGILQLGNNNAASPISQTLQAQGSRGGTDTDIAGGNLTIQSGTGTGTGTGSSIIFKAPVAGTTGTTSQTQNTILTLKDSGTGGTSAPQAIFADGTAAKPSVRMTSWAHGIYAKDAGALGFAVAGAEQAYLGSGGIDVIGTRLGLGSGNTYIYSAGNNIVQFGAAPSATPSNYTLQAQGSRGGTDTDIAGANLTIRSGAGTGAAVGSSLIFQTPLATTSGTTAQTQTERMRITGAGNVGIGTTAPASTLQIGSGQILVPDGTNAAPSIALTNSTNSGFYNSGGGAIGVSMGGTLRHKFTSGEFATSGITDITWGAFQLKTGSNNAPILNLSSGGLIAFSNTANNIATVDTGISRGAAGKIYVGNGTQGDYTGTLIAGNVGIGTATPVGNLDITGSNGGNSLLRITNTYTSGSSGGAGILSYSDDGAAMGSGERLGFFTFGGAIDASHSVVNSILIGGFASEAWSGTNQGAYFAVYTTPIGSTVSGGRVERLRISDTGNVGIGTTNPGANLQITSSNPSLVLRGIGENDIAYVGVTSGNGFTGDINGAKEGFKFYYNAPDGNTYFDNYWSGGDMLFRTQVGYTAREAMRITSGGSIGIGITNPGASLDINGNENISYSTANNSDNNGIAVNATQSVAVAHTLRGLNLSADFSGTSGTLTGLNGLDFTVKASGSGGTVTSMNGISAWGVISTGATVSTLKLVNIYSPTISGTVTSMAGLSMNEITGATNNTDALIGTSSVPAGNFAIYNASVRNNYFAGNVGIGTTSPTVPLSVNGSISLGTTPVFLNGNSAGYLKVGTTDGGSNVNIRAYDFEAQASGAYGFEQNSSYLSGISSGVWQLGKVNTTTAGVAQTLQTQGAITTADTAGGSLTIRTGAGTGAAVGAPIYFATPDATTSGSTAQAQTTKMTILGNGKVGIGTTIPNAKLSVQQGADTVGSGLRIVKAGGESNGYWDQWMNSSNVFGLSWMGGSQLMSITSGGNVGIGTTAPGYTLTVAGTAWVTSGAWSGSDARWKQNITPISSSDALDKVTQLSGVTYNWNQLDFPQNNFDSLTHLGFIAQEVEKIVPDLVTTGADGYKGVDYNGFAPLVVEAIKELNLSLKGLDERVIALEANKSTGGVEALGQYAVDFFSAGVTSMVDGIAYMKGIVVDKLTVGSPDKRTGITLYDEVTGNPNCFSIANGISKTTLGECTVITPSTPDLANSYTPADVGAPVITLDGATLISMDVGATYVEPGALAKDSSGNTIAMIISGDVNTAIPGTYTITYSATNTNGVKTEATRTVIVGTTTPPVDTTLPPVDTTTPPADTTASPTDTTVPPVDTTTPPIDTTITPQV